MLWNPGIKWNQYQPNKQLNFPTSITPLPSWNYNLMRGLVFLVRLDPVILTKNIQQHIKNTNILQRMQYWQGGYIMANNTDYCPALVSILIWDRKTKRLGSPSGGPAANAQGASAGKNTGWLIRYGLIWPLCCKALFGLGHIFGRGLVRRVQLQSLFVGINRTLVIPVEEKTQAQTCVSLFVLGVELNTLFAVINSGIIIS